MSPEASVLSARTLQPATFLLLLARVQIFAVAFVALVLFDIIIPDTSREVVRHALLDHEAGIPYIQLWYGAVALLLMCLAVRFTTEAMFALVADDVFNGTGSAATFANSLPRALTVVIGVAAAIPLLAIGTGSYLNNYADLDFGSATASFVFGFLYLAIALFCAWYGEGLRRVEDSDPDGGRLSRIVLRLALMVTPVVIVFVMILAVWQQLDSSARYTWLSRYAEGDSLATFALDVFVFAFAAVSIRLTLQVLLGFVFPGDERSPGFLGRTLWVIARVVPLAVCSLIILNGLPAESTTAPISDRLPIPQNIAAYAIAAAFLLATLYGTFRTRFHIYQKMADGWTDGIDRFSRFRPVWHSLFALLMLLGLGTFALFYVPTITTDTSVTTRLGSLTIVFLWGFAFTVFFFPIAFLSHITRLPIIGAIFLAACVFSALDLNDNHTIRSAASLPEAAPPGSVKQVEAIEKLSLERWLATRTDLDAYERYPVFIIATEGGGIRAAYFTASLLAALQDICPAFAQHTIAISGVSGGSVGTAVFAAYAADIRANQEKTGPCIDPSKAIEDATHKARKRLRATMDADLLSPLLGTMLFPDALQRILPVPVDEFDRVRALEYAIEASWRESCANQSAERCDMYRLSRPISDLYGSTDVPRLFFNVTEVESGRIQPLATARLANPPQDEDTEVCKGADVESTGGLVLQDILKRAQAGARSSHQGIDPALSTSAVLSARFPYITPAGRVEILNQERDQRLCVRRYVDGGYFENSGSWLVSLLVRNMLNEISTAQGALSEIQSPPGAIAPSSSPDAASKTAADHARKKLAKVDLYPLIIRSTPCTRDAADDPCAEEGNQLGRAGWNELMSPPRALLKTREARATYSRQGLQSDINQAELNWFQIQCPELLKAYTEKRNELTEADKRDAEEARIDTLRQELVEISQQCRVPFPVRLVQLKFINQPGIEIPLSWLLSSRSQAAMDTAIDTAILRELDPVKANRANQRVESRALPQGAPGDVKGQFVTVFQALNNRTDALETSTRYQPAAD